VLRALRFEADFTARLADRVGSLIGLEAQDFIRKGDFASYLELNVDPSRYDDPKHFAEDYLVAEILRKSINLPLGVDRVDVARRKFFAAERHNAETNERLWSQPCPEWVYDWSREVLTIMGPLTSSVLERIESLCGHGPGASVGVKAIGSVKSNKYDAIPTVTERLQPFLASIMPAFVRDYWSSSGHLKCKVVRGSHHFTVTKDSESNRNAAKEPTWNAWLQKGIGNQMSVRLRGFGVNLRSQLRNQELARTAIEFGNSTVDLKQASDMIARNAVLLALCANKDPQGLRWYSLLDLARSHEVRFRSEGESSWHALEMFSSMGNGFTFPLETVLYLALVRTVVPRDEWDNVTVYGDDIILPQAYTTPFFDRLEYLGFQVNRSKTRLAGVFFESCGTDWFKGQNVRPFYLRHDPSDDGIPYALQTANALRLWLKRVYGYCPLSWKPLWDWCYEQIPGNWRWPVPLSLGDSGVLSSESEGANHRQPARRTRHLERGVSVHRTDWEGWVVKHVKLGQSELCTHSFGLLAERLAAIHGQWEVKPISDGNPTLSSLWSVGDFRETRGLEPIRGYLGKPCTEKVTLARWEPGFEWL
jgi:hypothetical protein